MLSLNACKVQSSGVAASSDSSILNLILLVIPLVTSEAQVRQRVRKVVAMAFDRCPRQETFANVRTRCRSSSGSHRVQDNGTDVVRIVGGVEVVLVDEGQRSTIVADNRRCSSRSAQYQSRSSSDFRGETHVVVLDVGQRENDA